MTPLLELNAVSKQFGQHRVLDEVSLTVHAGEVIVILGPSGCGKSTLLRTLNGLEPIQGARFASMESGWMPAPTGSGYASGSAWYSRAITSSPT